MSVATTDPGHCATHWVDVCALADIPASGARRVQRPDGREIAVFRTADDRVFALLDRCPHQGGPLSEGIVFDTHVACPLHNWVIDLATGLAAAPDRGCATRFPVAVVNARVLIDFDEPSPTGATDP